MKKKATSSLIKFLFLSFRLSPLLITICSCVPKEEMGSCEFSEIWSEKILSVEFQKTDTLVFYTDTITRKDSIQIFFIQNDIFQKSKLIGFNDLLSSNAVPLQYNVSQFRFSIECKIHSEKWSQVKTNSNQSTQLWIETKKVNEFPLEKWEKFLLGKNDFEPVCGSWKNLLKSTTQDESKPLKINSLDCLSIIGIEEDNWLKVRFQTICNKSPNGYGYMKWKDTDRNLLIKFSSF